jgi:NTP pyrophosphatase (non-canonical NTP hydrolase)
MREVNEIPITDEIVLLQDSYDSQDDMDVFTNQFDHALLCMARTYAQHRETKGDSWKEMTPEQLRIRLADEIEEYVDAVDTPNEHQELIDVLNVGLMLLEKLRREGYVENSVDKCDDGAE